MEDQELQLGAADIIFQTPMAGKIYQTAKDNLGIHITLNEQVPPDLGCAEAVSYVLKTAGINGIPIKGFPGTNALYSFLRGSMDFKSFAYTPGAIIISPSGYSTKNSPHGHVGICGKFGILSNDSNSGLFLEYWNIDRWKKYYGDQLGFPVYYFLAK